MQHTLSRNCIVLNTSRKTIFIANDSIDEKLSQRIYFSLRDARKTERGVSAVPRSLRANFPEYLYRSKSLPLSPVSASLSLSSTLRELALPRSYFTIPNCGRKSRKRSSRKTYREPRRLELLFLTCRRFVQFFSSSFTFHLQVLLVLKRIQGVAVVHCRRGV